MKVKDFIIRLDSSIDYVIVDSSSGLEGDNDYFSLYLDFSVINVRLVNECLYIYI